MKRLMLCAAAAGCLIAFAGAASAQTPPGEHAVTITAIPGVVETGARWEIAAAALDNMDGVVGLPDGSVIFAKEQTNTIARIDPAGHESAYVTDTHGAGSVSIDAQGRLYVVQRTCTDPGLHLATPCQEPTAVAELQPERKVLAKGFADGKSLGRVNDLVADGKGGAYFTSNGLYHVSAAGVVSVVADKDIRTNGLMLSPDGRTLYTTNNTTVVAFDVQPDGSATGRRTFGDLAGDTGGDGMAIDAAGRVYVTAAKGVHVFSAEGRYLGLIPTPRRPISVCFSGPGKKTLFIVGTGGLGPDGKEWNPAEGVRNNAKTLYRIAMTAEGFKGRPK